MKVTWDYYSQYIWNVIKFHGSSHHQPAIIPLKWPFSSLIYPAIKWIFSIVMLVYQRVNTLNEAMEDGNEHERDERQNLGFWSPPDWSPGAEDAHTELPGRFLQNLRRLWRFMIWICHIISVKWMYPYRFLIITRFMGNPWDIHWILVINRGIFHGDFPFWWDGNLVIWPRKLVLEDHPMVGKSYEAQWVFSDSSPIRSRVVPFIDLGLS